MEAIVQTSLPGLVHRGKVRDTYDLGDGLLLMVATDRISAFDLVLPTAIPRRGEVLARLSAFWFQRTSGIVANHLVAVATDTAALEQVPLPPMPAAVARRAMVVRRAQRVDVECVARGYIAGSAWEEYVERGTVQGRRMAPGLLEGDRLPEPIFTPTTKAEQGHDLPLTHGELQEQVGRAMAGSLEDKTLALYRAGHDYALTKGIIIADTKFEFGLLDGELIAIDEILTPDSSRFWDAAGYEPGKSQPSFDKQFVRDYLTSVGWDREPPAPELPPEVVQNTQARYQKALERLTDQSID